MNSQGEDSGASLIEPDLSQGLFFQNKTHLTFRSLSTYHQKQLFLGENNHSRILKDIIHINFIQLLQLNLESNHIQNIEPVNRLNSPYLRSLNLFDNCICTVRSLRKFGNSRDLFVISLEENFIMDPENFLEMPHQLTLRELGFDFMTESRNGEDIRWSVKLKNPEFMKLWFGGYDRIKQRNVVDKAIKKFPKIQFVTLWDNQ